MTSSLMNPNNAGNKSSLSISSMRNKLQRTKQRIASIPGVTTSPRKKATSTSSGGSSSSNGHGSNDNQHINGNSNSKNNNREDMLVGDFAFRYESFSDEDTSGSPKHTKSTSVDSSRSRSKSLSRSVSLSSTSSVLMFAKSKVVSSHESIINDHTKFSSSDESKDPVVKDSLLPPIPMDKPSNHEELHPTLPTSVTRGAGLLPPHTCSKDPLNYHHMSDSSTVTMYSVSTNNENLQSPAIQSFSMQASHKSPSVSSASSVLAKPHAKHIEDVLATEDALANAILKQVNNGESWEL